MGQGSIFSTMRRTRVMSQLLGQHASSLTFLGKARATV